MSEDRIKNIDNCELSEQLDNYRKEQIAISEGKDPETIEIYEKIYKNTLLSSEAQYEKLFGKSFNEE